MKYQDMLLSKNGLATKLIAGQFLKCSIGSRVPTVTELVEKLELSRGTIQNSIKFLQDNKAVRLESRGHMGNYLISKNTRILLEFACITSIVGAMPLPYSRKYEGFATGMIATMENQYKIPCSMVYMRGAKNRIGMLISDRCDYAVLSRYAAEKIMANNVDLSIIKNFGPGSYVSEHVAIFHDKNASVIKDGMRVGIDTDSIDHKDLTEKLCAGKNVEYIQCEYSRILERVIDGEIDVAIWNKDEITDKLIKVNYHELCEFGVQDNTEAVIVVNDQKEEIKALLIELIDIETTMKIQKLVLEGKITPNY